MTGFPAWDVPASDLDARLSGLIALTLLWSVTLGRVHPVWLAGHPDPFGSRRWAWAALASATVGVTADRGYDVLYRLTGIPNLGLPLTLAAAAVAVHALDRFLRSVDDGCARGDAGAGRGWRVDGLLLAVLVVVVVGSVIGPLRQEHDYELVHLEPAGPATIAVFLAVGVAAAVRMPPVAARCWALGSGRASRSLRWGLRGSAVAVVLVAVRAVAEYLLYPAVLLAAGGQVADRVHGPVRQLSTVAMLSAGALALGLGLPHLARLLVPVRRAVRAVRVHRDLRLLRRRLQAVAPDLPGPARGRLPGPGHLEAATYRTVIEIRDAYFLLRPYRDPVLEARALELAASRGDDRQACLAFAEAVGLSEALRRRSGGGEAGPGSRPGPQPVAPWPEGSAGAEGRPETDRLSDEVLHLRRVARAWPAAVTSREAIDALRVATGPA